MTPPPVGSRPRVEGDREQEILEATLEVLADVGYDRLTMDAVAGRAKASKATLYRRWNGKAALVAESLACRKGMGEPGEEIDTGSFRGDLLELFCGMGGFADEQTLSMLGAVMTAMGRDQDFAETFRREFIAPKKALADRIFRRAQERGEIRHDLDLEVLAPALPGIILHRLFLLGDQPSEELITRVIDHVIIPAATNG